MSIGRRRTGVAYLIPLVAGSLAIGCNGDEMSGPTPQSGPIIGSWIAASFSIDGFDVIAAGATISFTFSMDGTYSITVTGDQVGFFCEGTTNCTDGGTFSATETTVTFDEGTVDELTVSISIADDVLEVVGVIDGSDISGVFLRV